MKMVLDNYGAYISVEDRTPGDCTKGANFVILMRQDSQSNVPTEEEK